MVQAHQKQEEPDIPDFHPRKDGFVQSYKGTWKEQGMIAIAWLETADPHHLPRGVFLHGAYELSSTSERALGGPARGARQKDLGADLDRASHKSKIALHHNEETVCSLSLVRQRVDKVRTIPGLSQREM